MKLPVHLALLSISATLKWHLIGSAGFFCLNSRKFRPEPSKYFLSEKVLDLALKVPCKINLKKYIIAYYFTDWLNSTAQEI